MPEWEVIYKATADFSALMRAAAEARAALKSVQEAAQAEGNAEAAAALKAAAAHDVDTASIKAQQKAMSEAGTTAQNYNKHALFGGRSTMDERLRDIDRERQYTDLLNRSKQRGFITPQQDYAYRQQELQQRYLWNRAIQMGYQTPEQYLQYLQRERKVWDDQNAVWRTRRDLLTEGANAAAAHASAMTGTHMSAQQLADTNKGLTDYSYLLNTLPGVSATRADFDSAAAKGEVAAYKGVLDTIPHEVHTRARLIRDSTFPEQALAPEIPGQVTTTADFDFAGAAVQVEAWRKVLAAVPNVVTTRARLEHEATPAGAAAVAAAQRAAPTAAAVAAGTIPAAAAAGPAEVKTEVTGTGEAIAELGAVEAAKKRASGDAVIRVKTVDYQGALAELEIIKAQLKGMGESLVTRPRIDTESFLRDAAGVETEIRRVEREFASLGVAPTGLRQVKRDFEELQRTAATALPGLSAGRDIDTHGIRGAITGLRNAWQDISSTVDAVWDHMRSSSSQSANQVQGHWQRAVAAIGGFFAGFATTDATALFRGLARASDEAARGISTGFMLMTAAIMSVIQLLPALSAGLGAVAAGLSIIPNLVGAAAGGFALLATAVMPVASALGKYYALQQAGQAQEANARQAAMQNAQTQNAVTQAYIAVANASWQAAQTQVTDAHNVANAQFALTQAMQAAHQQQITSAHAVAEAQFGVSEADYQATQTRLADAHAVKNAQYSLSEAIYAANQQQITSTHDVANAHYAVSEASFQAAQTQINDAHAVAESQYNLARATVSAELQQEQSTMSLEAATHSYQNSVFAVTQAQYSLNMAWVQAARSMQDLQERVAYASLDLRGAQLQLMQAQQNYARTMAQSTSTALDRAMAAYQVQVAEKALYDTQKQATRNEEDLANARKYGADQTFGVTQAQHALAEAQWSSVQAQKQIAITQKQAAEAQIQSAHAVQNAMWSLQQALVGQAHDAVTTAHAQREAQWNLAQTIKEASHGRITSAHAVQEAEWALALAQRTMSHDQITSARAQRNAVYELAQAIYQQNNGRITQAHAVKEAEFALSQAYVLQAHDRVVADQQMQQAQFGLRQALSQAAIAAEAGGTQMVAAYQALQAALAKLSPSARRALEDLLPLLKWFQNYKGAQEALFSVLEPHLRRLPSIIKPLSSMLEEMARAAGRVLGDFVDWLVKLAHSPAWGVLTRVNADVIYYLGEAFLHAAKAVTHLAVVTAPFTEWAVRVFERLMDRMDRWAAKEEALGKKSGLARWLEASKKPLQELGHLVASVMYFFEILAGGTPKFNKQGMITGVIPSPDQYRNLQSFTLLVKVLADEVLPNLASTLSILARPEMADALSKLMGALSQLILVIVESPGFETVFQAFTKALAWFVNVLSDFMKNEGAGWAIGGVIGAIFAAITVTKLAHLGTLVSHLTGLYNVLANIGRLSAATIAKVINAVFGTNLTWGQGGGGAGGVTATSQFQTSVTEFSAAVNRFVGGSAAGTGTGAAEGAAGAGAGAAARGGRLAKVGGVAGLLGDLGLAVAGYLILQDLQQHGKKYATDFWGMVGGAVGGQQGREQGQAVGRVTGSVGQGFARAFTRPESAGNPVGAMVTMVTDLLEKKFPKVEHWFTVTLPHFFTRTVPKAWDWVYEHFMRNVGTPVANWFTKSLPDFLTKTVPNAWDWAYEGFMRNVGSPVAHWFGTSLPNFFGAAGKGWSGLWDKAWGAFKDNIIDPVGHFFGTTIPNWFGANGRGWSGLWDKAWTAFKDHIVTPFTKFFGTTIPNWFGANGKGWSGLWNKAWDAFHDHIISPFTNFFTRTIPGWIGGTGTRWGDLWRKGWGEFKDHIISPIGNWFTHTFPDTMKGAWKRGVNGAIDLINDGIDLINKITHVVGITAIHHVGKLQRGGEVEPWSVGFEPMQAGGRFRRMPGRGSVSGVGWEDSEAALLTPGEFVIREPARRAVDRKAPGFMDWLNHADRHLGYQAGGAVGVAGTPAPYSQGGGTYGTGISGWAQGGAIPGYLKGGAIPYYDNAFNSKLQSVMIPYFGWPGWGSRDNPYQAFANFAGKQVQVHRRIVPDVEAIGRRIHPSLVHTIGGYRRGPDSDISGYGLHHWGLALDINAASNMPNAANNMPQSIINAFGAQGGAGAKPGWVWGGNWSGYRDYMHFAYEGGTSAAGAGSDFSVGNIVKSVLSVFGAMLPGGTATMDLLAKLASLRHTARLALDKLYKITIVPLINHLLPGGVPRVVAGRALDQVRRAVDRLIDAQAAEAGHGPVSADKQRAQAYARSQLGKYGWGTGQFGPLVELWMGESGWDRFAENPSSGAFGIPQALPYSKMPRAAWPIRYGGQASAGAQIDWGLNYIKTNPNYGSPARAYALWRSRSPHWYAEGGPVGADDEMSLAMAMGGSPEDMLAMALGGPLNVAGYATGGSVTRNFTVPFAMTLAALAKRNNWISPTLLSVEEMNRLAASSHLRSGQVIKRPDVPVKVVTAPAAMTLAALAKRLNWVPATLNAAKTLNRMTESTMLRRGQQVVRPVPGSGGTGSGVTTHPMIPAGDGEAGTATTAQAWNAAMSALTSAYNAEHKAEDALTGFKYTRPRGTTKSEWSTLARALKALKGDQNVVNAAYTALTTADETKISTAQWDKLKSSVSHVASGGGWRWILNRFPQAKSRLTTAIAKAGALLKAQSKARDAWGHQFGPGGTTPGGGVPQVTGSYLGPGGTIAAPEPSPVIIQILGGPGQAEYGSWSPEQLTGMQDGGDVGDVAAMFSGGLATRMQGGGPVFVPMPPGLLRALERTASTPAMTQSRALSEAAQAVSRVGVQVQGGITVNNPAPEPAGQSITHAVNRLSFLAGRGA